MWAWEREPGHLGAIGDSNAGAGNVPGTSCLNRNEACYPKGPEESI